MVLRYKSWVLSFKTTSTKEKQMNSVQITGDNVQVLIFLKSQIQIRIKKTMVQIICFELDGHASEDARHPFCASVVDTRSRRTCHRKHHLYESYMARDLHSVFACSCGIPGYFFPRQFSKNRRVSGNLPCSLKCQGKLLLKDFILASAHQLN